MNYPIPNRKSANKEGNGHSRVAKKALTSELPPCKVDATFVFSSKSLCGSSSYATSPSNVSIFKALRAPAAGYLSSPCIMMTVAQRERCTATEQMLLLPAVVSFLLCTASWIFSATAADQHQEERVREFFGKDGINSGSSHTNNWAVLVCASRYWFNYRVSVSQCVCHFSRLD